MIQGKYWIWKKLRSENTELEKNVGGSNAEFSTQNEKEVVRLNFKFGFYVVLPQKIQ